MNLISSDGSIIITQQDCNVNLVTKPGSGSTLSTAPTPSFLFSGNGATIPLTGIVRISQASGNNIILNADGLFSPIPNYTESVITAINTATIHLSATGISGHTLQADSKISATTGNALIVKPDGLFVPITASGSYTDAQARNAISTLGPLTYNSITGVIGIALATTTSAGYLSVSDWNKFNTKEPAIAAGNTSQYWRGDKTWQILNTTIVPEGTNQYFTTVRARASISALAPILYSPSTGVISEVVANVGQDGYLSSSDWNTFNSKIGGGVSLASINAVGVYKDNNGGTLEFRGIRGGINTTLALVGDDIVINSDGTVPLANAGADQGIVLPTTSVNMTGLATTAAGTIISTTWLFISGPSAYSITDASSLTTTVTGLVQGNYVFRLVVVNSFGLVDTDDMTIIVSGSASVLDTIYVGVNTTGLVPSEADILASNSSTQNGALNVSADWTTLSASTPVYCYFAIPDTDSAHEKNRWYVDPLNNGNIGGMSDLFGALSVVTVSGVNYSVGITNYATQFTSVCSLQKV